MYEMKAMKCPECGATMRGGKCPNGCKPGAAKKGGGKKMPPAPPWKKGKAA